jgi:hypothetical protein
MTDAEVAKTWARCIRALRDRKLVRTANTPVGDYAERICCDRFDLERKGFSEKSIDAVDGEVTRYQIKGRRLTAANGSRQLSAIRDVEQEPFDVLLAVFFNEDLDVQEIWSIPCQVVKRGVLCHAHQLNAIRTHQGKAERPPRASARLKTSRVP